MFRTLQSKLMFFFLLLSLGSILFVTISIQLGFFGSFRDYVDTKRTEQVATIIDRLEREYDTLGRITGETVIPVLHHYGMVEQLYFRIYDQQGNVVADSFSHFQMMPRHRQINNETLNKEQYTTTVATLDVFYPTTFETIDSQFLKEFSKYIIGIALTMIVISVLVSFVISKEVSKNLHNVSRATKQLQRNNYSVRINDESQVDEIKELIRAFNELAQSLSKQEKLRKQFTSDLAHELRTPLSTLRSQMEAFIDGVWEPSEDRLKQGHDELMRLVRLVDDLEKLLAAENPQIQLHLTEVDVSSVFQTLEQLFQPLFQRKGVTLKIDASNSSLTMIADSDRFLQIMINLLNNALKYTNKGGIVTLAAEKTNDYLTFFIKDNGVGISHEDLPFVFERFYRGEKSRSRDTGGVGIGLAIVKALVDAHKGKIEIESEKNIGTTVKFSLQIEKNE